MQITDKKTMAVNVPPSHSSKDVLPQPAREGRRESPEPTELITFCDMLITIWRSRWLVGAITAAVLALSLFFAWFAVNFHSEGYFRFAGRIPFNPGQTGTANWPAGISAADYARYRDYFSTPERFAAFAAYRSFEPKEAMANVQRLITGPHALTRVLVPILASNGQDAQEAGKIRSNDITGLRISYDAAAPALARETVGLISRYVMDSIIYAVCLEQLPSRRDYFDARAVELARIAEVKSGALADLQRKLVALQQLASQHPGGKYIDLTDTGARMVPIGTLVVATQVRIEEVAKASVAARRELLEASLWAGYYSAAVENMYATRSGMNLIRDLEHVKNRFFQDKDQKDEVVKAVYAMIGNANQAAIDFYLNRSRFIAGPSQPEKFSRLPLVAATAILLGLLLSIVIILARTWRRQYRV